MIHPITSEPAPFHAAAVMAAQAYGPPYAADPPASGKLPSAAGTLGAKHDAELEAVLTELA